MIKRMVDSITPTDIPVNDPATGQPWDYVLGYVDGRYGPAGQPPDAWTATAWARFPNSVHVRCAVLASTLDADVLDRENGDATAAEAVAWVRAKRARGDAEPTVYVGLADWGALQAAFNAAGVPHPHYGVAAYPGAGAVQETLNGITSAFHQFADPQYGPGGRGSGGHFDLSVVVDDWLTAASPTTPKGIDMGNWFAVSQGGNEVGSGLLLENGAFLGLPIPASVRAAQAYSNLNDGASDADAMGRWQDLVTRFTAEAKVMAPQVTVAINGQPQQAQLNPSTGHYELKLVPDAPAQS